MPKPYHAPVSSAWPNALPMQRIGGKLPAFSSAVLITYASASCVVPNAVPTSYAALLADAALFALALAAFVEVVVRLLASLHSP